MVEVYREQIEDVRRIDLRVRAHPKWYRIYENKTPAKSQLWVVDEGIKETRRYCYKVIVNSTAPVYTDVFLSAVDEEPKFWFNAYGVLREQSDIKFRTVITITKK